MYLIHSLLTLCIASFAAGAVFNRAPYSNVTLTPTLPVSASTFAANIPKILPQSVGSFGTAVSSEYGILQPTDAASTGPQVSSVLLSATSSDALNATLSQVSHPPLATLASSLSSINGTAAQQTRISNATCTINIPSASLDYWFEPTYSHVVGIMTTQASNFSNVDSYTLVPYTTTFDASSALESNFACIYSMSYYSEWDFTITMCEEYTIRPDAATTSIAYRSAGYSPFPSGGVIPKWDAGLYDLYYPDTFPSATATITLGPNSTTVQTSATPFVYFTAYEIESGNTTETVQLPSTHIYPYWLKGIEEKSAATGPIPDGFLNQIPQSACDAGQLQAVITVLIVVDLYYQNWPGLSPALIHVESSVLGFDDGPVMIHNWDGGTSKRPPLTVADWDLPDSDGKPTPTTVKPNNRPNPIPTTQMRGVGNGNAVDPPESTRVTVGSVGTQAVVVGPSSEIIVGSQTLQAGGPPVNIGGGTLISLVPSATAIVVNGRTSSLPQVAQSRPPPVLTIGSTTLTPNAATQFFVGPGQTLTPGGVATVDGTIVSLALSASFVVIGGSTQALPGSLSVPRSPPQLVIGSSTITAQATQDRSENSNNQNNNRPGPTFIVSGQTLAPGAPAITVSGTTLSLASSASFLVVDGVTSVIPNPAAPTINVGNNVFTPLSASSGLSFIIGDQTLMPGGPAITFSGTTLSLAPSASFVVVDGVTSSLAPSSLQAGNSPVITIGNDVISALPELSGPTFVIDGQTLVPGGPEITVSSTTLSLAHSASFIVINGVTSTLTNPVPPQITAPPLTIGDLTFEPLPGTSTAYLIGSRLLTVGGSIVVSGITISLAPGATALIVNGKTSFISPQAQPIVTNPPLLTIGLQTYTAEYGRGTTFVIEGQTLTPGGTITVDGTTIILASGATELIYGSSGRTTRSALFPATTTRLQSVTDGADASAGAGRPDGQATATSKTEGTASHSTHRGLMLFAMVMFSCSCFA